MFSVVNLQNMLSIKKSIRVIKLKKKTNGFHQYSVSRKSELNLQLLINPYTINKIK